MAVQPEAAVDDNRTMHACGVALFARWGRIEKMVKREGRMVKYYIRLHMYITLGYSVLCFALQQARPCIQVYSNIFMGHIQRTDRYDAALLNRHGERTVSFKKGRGLKNGGNIFLQRRSSETSLLWQ